MTEPSYGPNPTAQGVRGYRDLQPAEIDVINVIKDHEATIAQLWGRIESDPNTDRRWLAVARTHFQEGFSALVRSIAQPYDPFSAAFTDNQHAEAEQRIPRRTT